MTSPTLCSFIGLQGFRAYLKPRTFTLFNQDKPQSIAVFARNACGKSSLVDGFEFLFSEIGTLERLGQKPTSKQGGMEAIPHVLAEEKGIETRVWGEFRVGKVKIPVSRSTGQPRPDEVRQIKVSQPVDAIIRGYQLRRFVETVEETERYAEVARWLGLDPLVRIQENLTRLERDFKVVAEDAGPRQERLRDLGRLTSQELKQGGDPEVLEWINRRVLQPLDPTLQMGSLGADDPVLAVLKTRKAKEDDKLGLATLEQLRKDLCGIHRVEKAESGEAQICGWLDEMESSVRDLGKAREKEQTARARASSDQILLGPIWKETLKALEATQGVMTVCPVCETPLERTNSGSGPGLLASLRVRLEALAAVNETHKVTEQAEMGVKSAKTRLQAALASAISSFEKLNRKVPAEFSDYQKVLNVWDVHQPLPPHIDFLSQVMAMLKELDSEIGSEETKRGSQSYGQAIKDVAELTDVAARLKAIKRETDERTTILNALKSVTKTVNGQIRIHVDHLLGDLREDVNHLFRIIHFPDGENAPNVRLQMPSGKIQNKLALTIDFVNRVGVAPSGYLSDSQIHSLGLCLRLAAIRRFNQNAPFLILDDVVTSYDSAHRENIAQLIRDELGGFQVILVTHEHQFFLLLKEKLRRTGRWIWQQILDIEPGVGPKLLDDQTTDEEIETLHKAGSPGGNEIRKAEEEWLVKICSGFGIDVRMPAPSKLGDIPHFDRSELATGLESFLKKRKMLDALKVDFFPELKAGVVENAGSHFSQDAGVQPVLEEMKARWARFKLFRSQFRCKRDGAHRRFKRGLVDNDFPRCANCEERFEPQPPEAKVTDTVD